MTSIFAILFFVLTQLTVEQQLAEKYCPSKTNLKQPCPSCGSLQTITALCVFKTYNNSSGQNNCEDEQTRPDI